MSAILPDFVEVRFGDRTALFDRCVYLRLIQEAGSDMPLRAYVKRRGYAARPYVRVRGRTMPAARWVLGLAPCDPRHAHHVNGNTEDNRLTNLRALDPSEHGHRHRRRGRSGYRGVYPSASGRYRARFSGTHVGCYPTSRLAALAYDRLARRFMCEPLLNIPEGGAPEEMRRVECGLGPTAWAEVHIPAKWRPWRDTTSG